MLPWITVALFALAGCVSDELHEIPPAPVCAAPTFAPAPGIYLDSVRVSLQSPTPGATIRYTLNGEAPNDSSTLWQEPLLLRIPTTIRARAEEVDYQSSEVSTGEFDIRAARILLVAPNGGDTLTEGSTQRIIWLRTIEPGGTARVILMREDVSCDTLAEVTSDAGQLLWTVTACDRPGDGYRIRIEEPSLGQSDDSDAPFAIRTNCAVQVTVPNGWESWAIGSDYRIQWTAEGTCGDSVQIILLRRGSPCATLAEATANDGVFDWRCQRCQLPGDDFGVRVIDLRSGIYDDSDARFSIVGDLDCPVTLLTPNGGERWVEGTEQEIHWIPNDCDSFVRISYRRDGDTGHTIQEVTEDDGSFLWTVRRTDPDTSGYRVTVGSAGGLDRSDTPFTIVPNPDPCVMQIVEPNQQTVWREGTSPEIVWTSQHCYGKVKIEWLFSDQVRRAFVTQNEGRFPISVWLGSYRGPCGYSVRITDLLAGTVATTDGTFCMIPCELTVSRPAEGDTLFEGREYWIEWDVSESGCTYGAAISITLLLDETPCAVLADEVDAYLIYGWVVNRCVTEAPGPYRIVVREGSGVPDTSGAFTIVPPLHP